MLPPPGSTTKFRSTQKKTRSCYQDIFRDLFTIGLPDI